MKVLLTGAAGKIGHEACRYLVENGHEVRATDIVNCDDLPVRLDVADLLDPKACHRLAEGMDAVVHLANYPTIYFVGARRTFKENVAVNGNMLKAVVEHGVRKIIFTSSVQAFSLVTGARDVKVPFDVPSKDVLEYLPMDGDMLPRPINAYSLSKAVTEGMIEYAARMSPSLSAVVVRFPLIIRPDGIPGRGLNTKTWKHGRRLKWYVILLYKLFPSIMSRKWKLRARFEGFTYLHVQDAASLLGRLVVSDLPGFRTYFPAAEVNLLGRPARDVIREFYPDVPLRKPLDQIESIVDISRIKAETGWSPEVSNKMKWPPPKS